MGYKPILGVSEEEEKEILRSWIREKEDDLTYRFGPSGSIDPSSQTEDLGDDAIKASEYGIKNLKRIYPSSWNGQRRMVKRMMKWNIYMVKYLGNLEGIWDM